MRTLLAWLEQLVSRNGIARAVAPERRELLDLSHDGHYGRLVGHLRLLRHDLFVARRDDLLALRICVHDLLLWFGLSLLLLWTIASARMPRRYYTASSGRVASGTPSGQRRGGHRARTGAVLHSRIVGAGRVVLPGG